MLHFSLTKPKTTNIKKQCKPRFSIPIYSDKSWPKFFGRDKI